MQSRLVSFHKAKHANPMEHSQLFPKIEINLSITRNQDLLPR